MTSTLEQDASTFDEATARRALAMASTNVLRIALYQATGDEELARMRVDYAPFWAGAYEVPVLAPEHEERVPEKAIEFLRSGAASRCESPDDVDATIEKAMAMNDAPVVVDFIVSRDAMVWPMVAAGTSNDDIKYARDLAPRWDRED